MAYTFKHGDRPVEGYTIQRAVGKGGFGEVYYAVSDGGREVAIKYLRDNPQVELRGVSNCINLKSPHLVSIFDVKKTIDGEYAIIMEYCSGPSLRDLLIAEPTGFGPQKAAFFLREIAKGLSYLHERGIVHRDLKPGNIFYDDGYVKIGDYGLSKFISISRHSGQTASVGTVHYMAPEIGSGNYSKGVDIYALGVMLYEMVLGKVPFEGSTMAEVLMKHLTTRPELDELPEPFGRVIRKALEKDPLDRYDSVDEMVDELLEVDTVRESLAGFSTKSLEGAVHRGTPQRADSPMPSPSPTPGYARDFAQPLRDVHGPPPYAKPIGPAAGLPDRLAKRMERISRKVDAKLAKLGGRPTPQMPPTPPPSPPAGIQAGSGPAAAVRIAAGDQKKRIVLSALLSLGLAVGMGVLIGNTRSHHGEEYGIATGVLVIMMSAGIVLSRAVVGWFGVGYGPKWPRQLIRLCCCTPLMAIGAAPLFDTSSKEGAAVWLGLLVLAVFFREGEKEGKPAHKGAAGELSFGCALWTALWGLIFTAIAGALLTVNVEHVMFVGAGVAGAVSLIIQATAWWLPAHTSRALERLGGEPAVDRQDRGGERETPPPPDTAAYAPADAAAAARQPIGGLAVPTGEAEALGMGFAPHPHLRWGITRAFWGLVAFILMGGAIVTFLIPLVTTDVPHADVTTSIIACTAFASFMLFALRKTSPLKREGFWRETVRPFAIAVVMSGIGASITLIAREWSCRRGGLGIGPEGRVASITGLVMCSVAFLGLLLFTGRRPRAPKPLTAAGKDEVDTEARGIKVTDTTERVEDLRPRRRAIARVFWVLVTFAMMGGAVATFLISLIGDSFDHDEITGAVAGCTGFASFMLFALRKTTPVKRDGFWRETLRPLLIALTMFGIGGMITLIAREWSACNGCGGLDDQGRIGVITGLVMFSLLFLGLTFFTGRRRRAPKPFVLTDAYGKNAVDAGAPAAGGYEELQGVSQDSLAARVRTDGPAAYSLPAGTLAPHRGVTVLVLGILGVTTLFPLGIAAWVMGNHDLLEMDVGRMDPSGRGLTAAGKVCGMVSVLIAGVGTIIGLVAFAATTGGAF